MRGFKTHTLIDWAAILVLVADAAASFDWVRS